MILQSYSNQNNVVLAQTDTWLNGTEQSAQKQTHTPMGGLQQRREEETEENKRYLQQVVLGKLGSRV